MVATFSTLEGPTHQGDQGGSPSADFQSPRKPPGARSQHPWMVGGRPTQRGLQPPHTFQPTGILPNTHHLVDKPIPRTFRTVQSCDRRVEDPEGSKRGKPRASQSRKPATLPAHVTRSPAHSVDKVFPKAPWGEESHTGWLAGRSWSSPLTGECPSPGAALDERACRHQHRRHQGAKGAQQTRWA